MKKLSTLILLTIFSSCTGSTLTHTSHENKKLEIPPTKTQETLLPSLGNKAKECLCVKMWAPVCGDNGVTYGNSCEAKCAGVKFSIGTCAKKI